MSESVGGARAPRAITSSEVEQSVLENSRRRCALCYFLSGDLKEKLGQIAHIDRDRSNSSEPNLAFLCLEHHSKYDSKTSQHKNYTPTELKMAKNKLHQAVAEDLHLANEVNMAGRQAGADADRSVLKGLLDAEPLNRAIKYVRLHDFGDAFNWECLWPLEEPVKETGPQHEFLDGDLERLRQSFLDASGNFAHFLAQNTWYLGRDHWASVPSEWLETQPARFDTVTDTANRLADTLCDAWDNLIRAARRTLER